MDPATLQTIVQFGFAGVAVWLLGWVLKENTRREERLMSLIEQFGEQLSIISETQASISVRLKAIDDGLTRIDRGLRQ